MLYDKKRWELDTIGKALLDAADYMAQHGWCRGIGSLSTGEVCLIGAIDALRLRGNLNFEATRRLVGFLGNRSIVDWNDHACSCKDEAVDLLREAAYYKELEVV